MSDVDRFREYLKACLSRSRLSMRALSVAMGRDPGYIAQLMNPQADHTRALPTPENLRLAAPVLGVALSELLEVTWRLNAADIIGNADEFALALADTTPEERKEILDYISFIRARRTRQLAPSPDLK